MRLHFVGSSTPPQGIWAEIQRSNLQGLKDPFEQASKGGSTAIPTWYLLHALLAAQGDHRTDSFQRGHIRNGDTFPGLVPDS